MTPNRSRCRKKKATLVPDAVMPLEKRSVGPNLGFTESDGRVLEFDSCIETQKSWPEVWEVLIAHRVGVLALFNVPISLIQVINAQRRVVSHLAWHSGRPVIRTCQFSIGTVCGRQRRLCQGRVDSEYLVQIGTERQTVHQVWLECSLEPRLHRGHKFAQIARGIMREDFDRGFTILLLSPVKTSQMLWDVPVCDSLVI